MNMTKSGTLPVLRAALLMLCTTGVCGLTMHAQDAPPPPPSSDGQGPPADGQGPPQMSMGRGHGMDSERQIQMMTRQLNLSPDQVTKLKAIDAGNMQQMMALHSNTSLSQADMRTQMMGLRKEREAQIRAMLTDEQKTKYDAMQARMRERRMEHQGQGQGQGPDGGPPTGSGSGDATPPPPPQS